MKTLCMYIITQLLLSVCLLAQPLSPKVVLEIPAEKANYYIGDHRNVIGPNAIDIDQNGDIYIGGGSQIFVYNKYGEHLRTITSRRYFRRIHDIAVGTDDKLYVLVGKRIYLVEKNKGDEEGISIVACYSFRMASFSGITVTDDNQCLISRSKKDYYALIEADTELHEKATNNRGYPFYTCTLKKLYHGQPLKSSRKVVFLSDKGQAIDLTFGDVVSQESTAEVIDKQKLEYQRLNLKYSAQTHKRFADMIPAPKRERYQSIRAIEIIASGNSDKLFVRLSGKPFRKYASFTEPGYIIHEQFFCVMTKSGEFISIIDNIPKDLAAVNNISDKGKSFSIGPDERLYYLYTDGDIDNLDSCVTRVLRW